MRENKISLKIECLLTRDIPGLHYSWSSKNEIQQSQNSIPAAAQTKAGWGGIKSCQEMLNRVGIFYALDAP